MEAHLSILTLTFVSQLEGACRKMRDAAICRRASRDMDTLEAYRIGLHRAVLAEVDRTLCPPSFKATARAMNDQYEHRPLCGILPPTRTDLVDCLCASGLFASARSVILIEEMRSETQRR